MHYNFHEMLYCVVFGTIVTKPGTMVSYNARQGEGHYCNCIKGDLILDVVVWSVFHNLFVALCAVQDAVKF